MRYLAVVALVVGCADYERVELSVTSPRTISLGHTTGSFDSWIANVQPANKLIVYIASDDRGDDYTNPAPVRLTMTIPRGGTVELGSVAEGGLLFRDLESGVNCKDWNGEAHWDRPEPNFKISFVASGCGATVVGNVSRN